MLLPPTWWEDYTQTSFSQRVPETARSLRKRNLETSTFISQLHSPKQRSIYFYPITLEEVDILPRLDGGVGWGGHTGYLNWGWSQGIFSITKTTSQTSSSPWFLLRGRKNYLDLVSICPLPALPNFRIQKGGWNNEGCNWRIKNSLVLMIDERGCFWSAMQLTPKH